MKRKKLLFVSIVLALITVFSCGVSADVPTFGHFSLDDVNPLTYTETDKTITFTEDNLSFSYGSFQKLILKNCPTANVLTITVPKGTTEVYFTRNTSSNAFCGCTLNPETQKYEDEIFTATDGMETKFFVPIKTSIDDTFLLSDKRTFKNGIWLVYFIEDSSPTVKSIDFGARESYIGNTLNNKVEVEFADAADDTAVNLYITDKEKGTSADALEDALIATTVGEYQSAELPINDLPAGSYWIAAEIGDSRQYAEFTMYASARDYAEATLDKMVKWYQKTGFYKDGEYLGLAGDTNNGTGIDWEAYAFGALGYANDSTLLRSADRNTYLDNKYYGGRDATVESLAERSNYGDYPAKRLARTILGITGIGGDPRTIANASYVEALISLAYKDHDIASGELILDEDGCFDFMLADTIEYGYLLLALEVVNATPEEGYTEEMRAAGLKTLKRMSDSIDYATSESGFGKGTISDYYSMTMFPLEFMNDVEGMEGVARELLDEYVKEYATIAAQGSNCNSPTISMATTMLVSAGVTLEEFATDEKWLGANGVSDFYRSYSCLSEDGCFKSISGGVERLINYEALQALADLLNGKTCFRVAHENYMKNYPQYSDEYAAGKAVEDEIAAIGSVSLDSKAAIEAARAAYDALSAEEKAFVSNADTLFSAESIYSLLSALESQQGKLDEISNELAWEKLPGAETLKDMTDRNAWYYEAVDWAVKMGFFNGDDKGNFNPGNNITRAEFAQMLYNYYKDDATVMKDGEAVSYNDVAAKDWYYEAVTACSKAGIFKGDDLGNFNPNAYITRQDAALVLMRIFIGEDAIEAVDVDERLADLKDEGMEFGDFYETAAYAQQAMAAAAGVLFNGDDHGNLNPAANITRAETAKVMYNSFQGN